MNKLINLSLLCLFSLFILVGCENKKDEDIVQVLTGIYGITNKASEMPMDGRGFRAEGARIDQRIENSCNENQLWHITLLDDGYYSIKSLTTGMAVAVSDDGSRLVQQRESQSAHQKWEMIQAENGYIKLKNKETVKVIDNMDSMVHGTAIGITEQLDDIDSQLWRIEKLLFFDELASYYIENINTSQVLAVLNQSIDYGAAVIGDEKNETYNHQWFIDFACKNTVHIKNLHSSKMLTVKSDLSVVVEGIAENEGYDWILSKVGDAFHIINSKNGEQLVIDGNQVKTLPIKEDEPELWRIYRVYEEYEVPPVRPLEKVNDTLVGVISWSFWNENINPDAWTPLIDFPKRKPVLGFYNDSDPRVVDWQIKMAVESGIDFFAVTWYPARLGHWLEAYKQSRYKEYLDYALFFINNDENIVDKQDLLENLMPYWIENHFKDPNYIVVDGKPVISFYRRQDFIDAVGGPENANLAIAEMKKMTKEAGFEGLTILMAHHWGSIYDMHNELDEIGVDGIYSYHVPTFGRGALDPSKMSYTNEEILEGHLTFWQEQAKSSLPTILTVSMGWDSTPWNGFVTKKTWRLTPDNFAQALRNAKHIIGEREDRIDSKMVLIDNLAEYGEGHYIFPTEEYGFGYFNGIRKLFSENK